MDGQLWSVALLVAHLLGDAALSSTAAAMAQSSVAGDAPLHTLLLLLGGAPANQPLMAAAAAAATTGQPAAADPAAGWQQPGVFNPGAADPGGSGGSDSWRHHLAIIAANRTAGDEAAMLQLGSQLLAAGQLLPAHICFVLSGALLQPWDVVAAGGGTSSPSPGVPPLPRGAARAASPAPPLVLLGVDVVGQPRSCTQLRHILATEVFTWSRTVGA